MITDLMRNDLSRVCAPGSVAVTGLLEIQPHPGVWHLVSTVTGVLAAGVSPADLLAATFPPGSVTGAPKSSAVRAIAAEEGRPRGAYTGAAGLMTVDGRAELSVLIRTFEATAGRVELGVGGGITVDSVPVREWQECLHKAEPLALAAASRLAEGLDDRAATVPDGLATQGVFESILSQHGHPLRLADHLARLARSARELYAADLPSGLPARIADELERTAGAAGCSARARQTECRRTDRRHQPASTGATAAVLHSRTRSSARPQLAPQMGGPIRTGCGRSADCARRSLLHRPLGLSGRDQPREPLRAEWGRDLADAAGDRPPAPRGDPPCAPGRARRSWRAGDAHARPGRRARLRPDGGVVEQPQRCGGRPSGEPSAALRRRDRIDLVSLARPALIREAVSRCRPE